MVSTPLENIVQYVSETEAKQFVSRAWTDAIRTTAISVEVKGWKLKLFPALKIESNIPPNKVRKSCNSNAWPTQCRPGIRADIYPGFLGLAVSHEIDALSPGVPGVRRPRRALQAGMQATRGPREGVPPHPQAVSSPHHPFLRVRPSRGIWQQAKAQVT